MKFTADFAVPIRKIGELNGANNGPLHTYTDRSAEYRDMGIKFVRFHETHSQEANCVEMPHIFRDFDKDENDPANYYFGATDAVITAAHNEGIEIMYRLGMGTENLSPPRRYLEVPRSFIKWAKIAEHIIAHYNEGWANGFHYNIRYWEIWNEADIVEYWPASRKTYLRFYSIASNYLKKRFPDILIGPSGFANMLDPAHEELAQDPEKATSSRVAFYRSLFRRAAKGEYPMDFFPWHFYGRTSAKIERYCSQIDQLKKEHGFDERLESINTEWNAISLDRLDGKLGAWDMSQMTQMKSAICAINAMIVMQKHGVTKAAYYNTDEVSWFCGFYYFDGEIRNHYYSMKAFQMLKEAETEVETTGDSDTVRMCAAGNAKKGVVLIGNESKQDEKITLTLKNIGNVPYTLYLFDAENRLKPVRHGFLTGRAVCIHLKGESAAVMVIDREGK